MKKFKFIFVIVLLFVADKSFAASLSLESDSKIKPESTTFTSTVYLNTEGEQINTLEGDLSYDKSLLQIEVINTGSSFVSFWVEKPENKIPGLIHFSGITPGGVLVNKGEVFQVVFRAKAIGLAKLSLNNVSTFLNDGKGTVVKNTVFNDSIKITPNLDGKADPNFVLDDKIAPESFSVVRSRDPAIFDGKYFIVFSTNDKGSGIGQYQVCEFFSCVNTDSPYLLKNQTPFYYFKVKAYDLNGNFSSSTVVSPYMYLLLLLSTLFIYFLYRYLKRVRV